MNKREWAVAVIIASVIVAGEVPPAAGQSDELPPPSTILYPYFSVNVDSDPPGCLPDLLNKGGSKAKGCTVHALSTECTTGWGDDCLCDAAFSVTPMGASTYPPLPSSGAQPTCYPLSREETCKSADGTVLQATTVGRFCTLPGNSASWEANGTGSWQPAGASNYKLVVTSKGGVSPDGREMFNYVAGVPFPNIDP